MTGNIPSTSRTIPWWRVLEDEDRTSMEAGYAETIARCPCCRFIFIVANRVYCDGCQDHMGRDDCLNPCNGGCLRCPVNESQALGWPYPWEEAAYI